MGRLIHTWPFSLRAASKLSTNGPHCLFHICRWRGCSNYLSGTCPSKKTLCCWFHGTAGLNIRCPEIFSNLRRGQLSWARRCPQEAALVSHCRWADPIFHAVRRICSCTSEGWGSRNAPAQPLSPTLPDGASILWLLVVANPQGCADYATKKSGNGSF